MKGLGQESHLIGQSTNKPRPLYLRRLMIGGCWGRLNPIDGCQPGMRAEPLWQGYR